MLRKVLELAGWPEALWEQAIRVVKGSANCPWGESNGHPASQGADTYGLFQLSPMWFAYADMPFESWRDPVVNAKVALAVYRYDIAHHQAPWTQWSCKP